MGFGRNNRIEKKGKKKRRKVATDKKSQKDGLSVNRCWSNLWIMQHVILNARYHKGFTGSVPNKKRYLLSRMKKKYLQKNTKEIIPHRKGDENSGKLRKNIYPFNSLSNVARVSITHEKSI